MARSAILAVKILVDAQKAQAGLDKASSGIGKFQEGLGKAALPAAAVGAAVLGLAKTTVASASRLQQAVGGVDAVFKGSADQVHAWANEAADSAGLSASAYSELATTIGSQLKNAGVPMDDLAGQTDTLIRQGADMAAMFGGTTAQAVEALSSALKGETDPIEKYGVSIKQADIAARMAADGTDKLTGKAAKTAKSQATLALITEQSADAHGAFAREADSAATAQQKASAEWENAKASLGTILLPLVSKASDALGGMAKFASENTTAIQIMLGVVGGLAAAILGLNGALKAYQTVAAAVQVVQKLMKSSLLATRIQLVLLSAQQKIAAAATAIWSGITTAAGAVARGFRAAMLALNSSFLANPIVLIVVAIIALIAVIVIAYKRSATFRKIVDAVFASVARTAKAVAKALSAAWKATWRAISSAAKATFRFVSAALRGARAVATTVARGIRAVWSAVFRAIATVVRAVMSAIRAAIRGVSAVIHAYVRGWAAVFRAVFGAIRSAASAVAGFLRSAFATVAGPVRALAAVIRNTLASAFGVLRRAASGLASALSAPFHTIESAIRNVIGAVESLIGWLGRIKVPKISLPHIGGNSAAVAAGPTAVGFGAGLRGSSRRGSRAAAAPVTIVVQGALDPDAVARQIETLLRRRANRVVGVRRTGFAAGAA